MVKLCIARIEILRLLEELQGAGLPPLRDAAKIEILRLHEKLNLTRFTNLSVKLCNVRIEIL